MLARKQLVLISGVTLACAGLLFAEIPSTSPETPVAKPETSQRNSSASKAEGDRAARAAGAIPDESDSQTPARLRVDEKLTLRIPEMEERLTALQAKCDALERRLNRQTEELVDVQARLEVLEGHQYKTQAQVVSFQVKQKERQLNPTERRQIAELIGQRVFAAQNQWIQALRTQTIQPVLPPHHEEPLYAP